MTTPAQVRRVPALLLALTAVTGLVDAVSYLALGHVFTANMTGNIVFIGFALADTPGLSIARSGAALFAFLVGATIGGRMAARSTEGDRHRLMRIGFAIESTLLFVCAAIAATGGDNLLADPARLYALIVLTAVAMGVRNAVVRTLGEKDLTTTVLTLTLTGLAADSVLAGGNNPGWMRRASSVALMLGGAVAGALLLRVSFALPLAVGAAVSGGCVFGARLAEATHSSRS
jgi:uncharacterized membrane protein YoaK (UPF0700 family)